MADIYTGITIGPIYDTISLTSSPAGLWAASYMFSHISRRLCELIVSEGIVSSEDDIKSPYFKLSDKYADGIGRYHDRIIFFPKDEATVLDNINAIFDKVTIEVASAFCDTSNTGGTAGVNIVSSVSSDGTVSSIESKQIEWFKQYLQLHALCFPSEGNVILDSAQYLDAIELEKSFPTIDFTNPINKLFEDEQKNTKIRIQFSEKFNLENTPFPLRNAKDKNNHILKDINGANIKRMPDMEEICGRADEDKNSRVKVNSYYAIVQSDGDRIGEYIKGCKERGESERDFSKICLSFCSKASEIIQNYGGVTIYAGGDDLLFIAPLVSQKVFKTPETNVAPDTTATAKTSETADTAETTKTSDTPEKAEANENNILSLLIELRNTFHNYFPAKTLPTPASITTDCQNENKPPTLSFGVAIRYYKYPLYEAFDEACALLFQQAKKTRDAVAISLRKHSGQDIQFILENFTTTKITDELQTLIAMQIDSNVLKSIRGKIWEYKSLFLLALKLKGEALKSIFDNTFDSKEVHNAKSCDIDATRTLLEMLEGKDNENILIMLDNLLRFVRFWSEKGDEDNAETAY